MPDEVFMPGELIGRSKDVIRDSLGKIIYFDYAEDEEPTLIEHFECENCGKSFVVEATVTFKTSAESEELDFGNKTVSLLED